MTHGGGVDEDDNDYHQQEDDDAPNDVPLVVAPDDVLEGLPGRGEPQERGGWTTVCVCVCVCVLTLNSTNTVMFHGMRQTRGKVTSKNSGSRLSCDTLIFELRPPVNSRTLTLLQPIATEEGLGTRLQFSS